METWQGKWNKEQVEARLQKYQVLLEKRMDYREAIRRTENFKKLSLEERLYLYVFAPVLTEYVTWVLGKAVSTGRKRLYFLSRDGFSMYRIAVWLTEFQEIPMECGYLHVSRYACRIPAYHLDLENCLEGICTCGIDVTLKRILRRGGLTEEESGKITRQMGWEGREGEILHRRQILEVKENLQDKTKILEYIERHSREAYESVMGYLEQEGLLSDIPYAIVDSGWVGTLQQTLQRLVASRKPDIRIQGYYFGMYETPGEMDPADYQAWYFSPDSHLRRKVWFSNSLFEAVCSAPEGMTRGYICQDGQYLSVPGQRENPNKEQISRNLEVLDCFLGNLTDVWKESRWNKKDYRQTAGGMEKRNCRKYFRRNCRKNGIDGKVGKAREWAAGWGRTQRKLVQKLLFMAMAAPTETELDAWGDFLFSDDVLDEHNKKVAAELTTPEIKAQRFLSRLCILAGWKKGLIRESAWIEGSIVRCGMGNVHFVRNSLRHVQWYKYMVYGRKQLHSLFARAEFDSLLTGIKRTV